MDDEVKPKGTLFSDCDKLWTDENNYVNNDEQYSSSAETKGYTTSVDFNYAEVASCDENEELDDQQHSIIHNHGGVFEYTNLNKIFHTHDESNVITNVVYFNTLKNSTTDTANTRTLSNNITHQIEALYNCQLQRYISESGNTALYKYTQPTATATSQLPSLLGTYTLPHYKRLQSNVIIDESLGKLAVTPVFRMYQLLGDSQLLRFSEAILGLRRWRAKGSGGSRIGYCVSGQSVAELGARIRAEECRLKSEVVVLIGTNDMRRNVDVLPILEAYSDLIAHLERHCEKIVLLTVPPLPFMHDKDPKMHIDRLKIVNGFIKELANENNIFVLDLCSIFISFDNTVSKEYFEKFIRDDKVDLIHLNIFGLKMLRTLLDTQYFDKYKV